MQASIRNMSVFRSLTHTEIHPHNRALKTQHTTLYRTVTNLILDESLSEKKETVCTPHDHCLGLPEALQHSGESN